MASPAEILFVHEGKEIDPSAPIGLVPMGVLSMADWLDRSGRRSLVVHHAIEKALDPAFDVCELVLASGAGIVGLDLHWHQQARSVIELARRIRRRCPGVAIVLGGYTASAFDLEIMASFDAVDFIIRGDGEIPMLELARRLGGGGGLPGVPNLTWRSGSKVRRSRHLHVNDEEDLGRLRFSAFDLMLHHDVYTRRCLMEGRFETGPRTEPGIFYCNCGRGCPYDCCFCGGSRSAQRLIGGRRGVVYRPIPAMIADLERMGRYNLDTWYNTFHPTPDESYFLELFGEIRKRNPGISMIQECLHIPSEEFITRFAETFGPRSRMDFVLLTGSEALRRRVKDNFFGNDDLTLCLDRLAALGIGAHLCFLVGLPFEETADIRRTLAFIGEMRRRGGPLGVNAEILAIEPCAPMNRDPGAFGIVSHARTFMDYYRGHAKPGFVGYRPGRMSAKRASATARAYRAAFAVGRTDGIREKRVGAKGRPLVQLHTVNLWDGGMRYGLGAPSLLSYAASLPEVRDKFSFEQVVWKAQVPGESDPDGAAVAERVLRAGPLVAGFTIVSWSEKILFAAIRRVKAKKPGVMIAVGGPLASAHGPRLMKLMPEVDALVAGYGEIAFAALLRSLADGGGKGGPAKLPPGLYVRRGGRVVGKPQTLRDVLPPGSVPSPFRAGLVDVTGCPTMHVEWSRGCPGRCAYCSWGNRTDGILQASREKVMDDIAWAVDRGVREITLDNSAINFRTDLLRELVGAIADGDPRGTIALTAFLRYELLDEKQVDILRRVNWKSLIMGLQTDDAEGLRLIGRPPFDRGKFERAVSGIGAFARPGVQIITAVPGDTFEKFSRRLEYLVGLDCDLTVFPLQVTPGTRLWSRRKELGLAPDPDNHYWVYRTPTLSEAGHRSCIETAARRLDETRARGGKARASHGVSAARGFEAELRKRAGGSLRVQLHDANVFDGGMHFGLGVPFLVAHCRRRPGLAEKARIDHVAWKLRVPGLPDPACDAVVSSIIADAPHVAGFSLQPWSTALFLDAIRALKKKRPGVKVVVGGPNAMLLGEELLREVPQIDVLVTGEGEMPFADLLETLAAKKAPAALKSIGGLFYRRGGKIVSTGAPRLPRGGLDYCGSPVSEGLVTLRPEEGHLAFEWTRGCPNRCSYCSWHRNSRAFRRFSRDRIIDDVRWAREKGFREILICDAAINYRDDLLRELCDILVESNPRRDMAFGAFVQHYLLTERQVRLMKPVRWFRIMTGLQTDDAAGLRVLGRPPFERKRFERAMKSLSKLSVPYVEIMTGVPGDTAEKLETRLAYLLGLGCRVSMFPLQVTPGTGLWRMREKLGLVLDPAYQHVVRETPTLPHEPYRDAIGRAMALGKPREELEIAGYEFMALGAQGGSALQPQGPGRGEIAERLRRIVETLGKLGERAARSAPGAGVFVPAGIEELKTANVEGWRLTFALGKLTLRIDAFRRGDVSMPVASGPELVFCPVGQGEDGRKGAGETDEAAMLLCRALARIDGNQR